MSRRHLLAALMLSAMTIPLISCKSSGTSTTNPIDLSAPQAPTNLRSVADPVVVGRETLFWDASASAGVLGYEVYSSTTPSGTATLVSTVNAGTTDLVLPLVAAQTMEYYRVRAIGSNNVPSAFTSTLGVDRIAWDGGGTGGSPGKGTEGDF